MSDRIQDMGVPYGTGSRPTDRAADGVSPVPASIPNAAALNLRRIEAIAITPGRWSGPAFDEIARLAAESLEELGDR